MKNINELLANPANRIAIVSGEGEDGTVELFTGKRTRMAIARRLTKERYDGDRWAYAVIDDGDSAVEWNGNQGIEQTDFPDLDD